MRQELDWSKYGPEIREAFEILRAAQFKEGFTMKVEMLKVSEDGAILLNPENLEHRAWMRTMRMMTSRIDSESFR